MTLSSTQVKESYAGTGSTVSFPIPFVFWDDSDIEVILRTDATGAEVPWADGTQYTLSGGDGSTGILTVGTFPLDYTPATGETLVIRSNRADTQPTDFPLGGSFPSTSAETANDQQVRLTQQQSEELGRAFKISITVPDSPNLEISEPKAGRIGKYLLFDANGDLAVGTIAGDGGIVLLDEDDMASNSDTHGVTQQSLVAYIANLGDTGMTLLDEGDMRSDSATEGSTQRAIRAFATQTFSNVAGMIASTYLNVGETVRTLGYHYPGDGGASEYAIVNAGTATEDLGKYIDLSTHQASALFTGKAIDISQFGAKDDADGVGAGTDSTININAAIDHAESAGKKVTGSGSFKITSKVTIKGDCDFSAALFYVYNTPAIAVEVSTGDATNPTTWIMDSRFLLPKEIVNTTKPGVGWAGQGIGLRIVNLLSCNVFVGRVQGFAQGLLVTAYGTGCAYNSIFLQHLVDNEINLAITPGNSAGFTNENIYIGGRLSHFSGEGTEVAGVRHILISEAANPVNNNLFERVSIEGNTPEYHLECGGTLNTFLQCRWETIGAVVKPKVLYTSSTSSHGDDNVILYGNNVRDIVFTKTGAGGGSKYNRLIDTRKEHKEIADADVGIGLSNLSGSDAPIHTHYAAGTAPEDASATEWAMKHSSQNLKGKAPADDHPRIVLNYNGGTVGLGYGSAALTTTLFAGGDYNCRISGTTVPSVDNTYACGGASLLWTEIFAAAGTINTSDERVKQQPKSISEKETAVAVAIKGQIKSFKFNKAVDEKGKDARIHFGVVAQEVAQAFVDGGLDPAKYGLFCYDEWEAEEERITEAEDEILDGDGNIISPAIEAVIISPAVEAGNRYGIRYSELLCFVLAGTS